MTQQEILVICIISGIFVALFLILFIFMMRHFGIYKRKIKVLQKEVEHLRHICNGGEPIGAAELLDNINEIKEDVEKIKEKQKSCLNKVNVVRYFATGEIEGRSSYSVGITDENKNGLVITGLMRRDGMNLYVKKVDEGISDYPLSSEEKEAVSRSKVTEILG